jgi:hypothetical protein
MYITKKFALKKTRLHSEDTYDNDCNKVKAYIEKGGVYYQMSNGTIGRGARSYNMSEQAMDNLINSTPTAWSKGSRIELKPDTSNVVELRPIKDTTTIDYKLTADDIPF